MSIVNPFQQINANLPQLAPAPLSPGFDPAQLGDSAPPQMPQSKRPQVFGPTPQDRQETVEGGKLEKDYQADLHPWGSPENHPGTGGKVGHVFSQIGNTLGDILAPKVMARIPGTQAYRQQEENGLEDRLNKLAQLQSQIGEQGAQTSHLKEETAEMPGKAESEDGLQGAQVRHLNDESEGLENPQPSFSIHDTEDGPLFVNNATGTAQHLTVDGVPVGPKIKLTQSQPIIGEDGKPHTYMLDEKGNKVTDLGIHYEHPITVNTGEKEGQNFFVPDGNGGTKMIRVKPGEPVPAGAQTAPGLNATNTPTMTQRTAAGRAETVVSMAPEVLRRIDAMAPKLGPIEGRWGDFMQGKVGMDDPDFAALRSDLLMMASAVALAHAQGRLPENLRVEFDRVINAPKQTSANLKATIQTILPWLQKMQENGQSGVHGNTPAAQGSGPAVGTVEGGYRFKGGDPSKQSNWEQVKK